jgi:CelD/BcsL family acetyltransferase involved in cellulose biosynthesis
MPRQVDPRTDAGWDLLARSDLGSLFSSPPWIRAVSATYNFEPRARVIDDNAGRPVAGLAYVELDDLRGERLSSLPFCDRVDPIVHTVEQWRALVDPLLVRRLPFSMRCLEAKAPLEDDRLQVAGEAAWHLTDLSGGEEAVFAGFHPQARQNVRSAQRRGVDVTITSSLGDVREFHRLHRTLRKDKYRLLAQPLELFERIWEEFAPRGAIVVALAHHGADVIAGALYLRWGDVLYYKFGASLGERLRVRPNELLAWEAMRWGMSQGCRRFDWGLSDLDQPGLVAYKRKLATEEGRIVTLRYQPSDHHDPRADEAGRLLGAMTALLTRDDVPPEITQSAGALLYRYFA